MLLSKNSQKVQDHLNQFGLKLEVVELEQSTRTAQDAADAIGCQVGQIVKSLIFRSGEKPLLFLVSGSNKLDTKKVSSALGFPLEKADADFVRRTSGYAIGGVPPVAHAEAMEVYIDGDLLGYETVWAAAGTPHAVFSLASAELPLITKGKVMKIK